MTEWRAPFFFHGPRDTSFISQNSSSDRKARRMTRRNAVFHEFGHALGVHHNYCEYSQMRSPNSKTTQPTNWGALDLMAIAAIYNQAVKPGASYSSDYDEGTEYSHGETLDSMREALGIAADASWEAMRTDRQLMCQRVDTGFWAEFAEATEELGGARQDLIAEAPPSRAVSHASCSRILSPALDGGDSASTRRLATRRRNPQPERSARRAVKEPSAHEVPGSSLIVPSPSARLGSTTQLQSNDPQEP